MAWNDDTARLCRMLEYVVLAAMALDPALTAEASDHFLAVCFGLLHRDQDRECANIGA
jgi:hypothetical protein